MAGKQFVCSTTTPQAWRLRHRPIEKCGQNVAKSGGFKKKDLVGCLNISNLQGLLVPSDVLFSNSMLEDMEKIWALRDIIPDPNCYGQKTEGIE